MLTFFGIPRYVLPGGLNMDADYLMQVVKARDGNADTVRQYMLSSGMGSSALEHRVPEQLFSTVDNLVEGISTVKALKIANDQGIPIYTINQQNIATTLAKLQVGQQVKDDIQNAVNAGKVVTVSKSNISFNGWNGCGYIITNPETGAGAYMITGGTNGAMLFGASIIISLFLLAIGTPVVLALIASLFMGVITSMANSKEINWASTLIGLFAGAGSTSFLTLLLSPQILAMPISVIAASPLGMGLIAISVLLLITYIALQAAYGLYAGLEPDRKLVRLTFRKLEDV